MAYKYIKCHRCYGKKPNCKYCDGLGYVTKSRGNKKKIDEYWAKWWSKH